MHIKEFLTKSCRRLGRDDVELAGQVTQGVAKRVRELMPEVDILAPAGLLWGLERPLMTSKLAGEDPWVFVSLAPACDPTQHGRNRPPAFAAVDAIHHRPSRRGRERDEETERVAQALQRFLRTALARPEDLLDEAPAFSYRLCGRDPSPTLTCWAPPIRLLDYALMERNPVVAGLVAGELARMARGGHPTARTHLSAGFQTAVHIEDAPFASMLLMGLAGAPAGPAWLEARAREAGAAASPLSLTQFHFRELARRHLRQEGTTQAAHWIHHDPCVGEMIATCTIDMVLIGAALSLGRYFSTEPIHLNHFMHGQMVLSELQARLEEVEAHRLGRSPPPSAAAQEAYAYAAGAAQRAALPAAHANVLEKVSLLALWCDAPP